MYFASLFSDPLETIFRLLAIVIAVTVHEFAHAKMADHLGDPTADALGRVSLDPRAHLDPLGSLLFLLIGFGWGKPVPFDPYNLENPRRDAALISFAGPASNIVMALVATVLVHIIGTESLVGVFLFTFIAINVVLAIFNMLPIAPLDGFKIVGGLMSDDQAREWYSLERYGIIFLLFFIFPFVGGRSMLEMFVSPVITFVLSLLLPS
jgi:Zn-dependent protease